MKTKSEASNLVRSFVNLIENQHKTTIKCIISDNGPEFQLKSFYESKGIIHQTSYVECPKQNGRVERKHHHVLSVARALLHQSKI